jgi:hypothetical protein
MINEHDCVVLTLDLAQEGLQAGDIGTVVHIHPDAPAYEVEFMTLAGETLAVVTLSPTQLHPIARRAARNPIWQELLRRTAQAPSGKKARAAR